MSLVLLRVGVWLLCIQLKYEAAFGAGMEDYSRCITNFLSLNTSAYQSSGNLHSDFSILSQFLHCDTETGLSLLNGNCITVNETAGLVEMGSCIYTTGRLKEVYVQLPRNLSKFNEFSCGTFNRTGTLCGQCKPDHYPLVYSFNMSCVPCSNEKNWWRFVLMAFLPQTVMYFLILLFRINIHIFLSTSHCAV